MKALSLLFACCSLLFVAGTAHAEQIPDAELEVQIRRILQEHPDIVLDILREHSETALDIVQLGADRRRSEALRSQWTEDAKTPKKATLEERPSRGPENAPVTLVAQAVSGGCTLCLQAVAQFRNRYSGRTLVCGCGTTGHEKGLEFLRNAFRRAEKAS